MNVTQAFWLTFMAAIVADVVFTRYEPRFIEAWEFWYGIVVCAVSVLIAGWELATGDWSGVAVWMVIAIGNFVYWWHRTRRRRKKLADKAAGIVVDAGGRLKIVREPVVQR